MYNMMQDLHFDHPQDQNDARVLAVTLIASAMNKEGANQLAQRDLPRAFESFRAASEILNGVELSLQMQQQQQVPHQEELNRVLALNEKTKSVLRTNPPNFAAAKTDNTSKASTNVKTFFICMQPFLFSPNRHAPLAADKVRLYKAGALYNLALVMHQSGNCEEASSSFQQKALSLYDLCLESLVGCGMISRNIDRLMLAIASLNNKAHILYECCASQNLQAVLSALKQAISSLPSEVDIRDGDDIAGVILNVYTFQDLHMARAA